MKKENGREIGKQTKTKQNKNKTKNVDKGVARSSR